MIKSIAFSYFSPIPFCLMSTPLPKGEGLLASNF